jgi:hypothetical protein
MNQQSRETSARSRIGAILLYLLSFLLAASAAVKFARVPAPAAELAGLGFAGIKLFWIAVLEITSAALLVYSRTRSFGILMISAYLGGATATHVGHDQSPYRPAIVLALLWLACWLRHPQMLWRADRSA